VSKFTGSACAKFILMGEHFVVHGGVPALAFPVPSLGTRVTVEVEALTGGADPIVCDAYQAGAGGAWAHLPYLSHSMERATALALDVFGLKLTPAERLRVRSETNAPVSRGFGSSAAFAAALARALQGLSAHRGLDGGASRVAATVEALEKHFHGKPSGVDGATVLEGRPIRFDGGVSRPLAAVRSAGEFVLVDSGDRDGCKQLVAEVNRRREARPDEWQRMATRLNTLVEAASLALSYGDAERLAAVVDENQSILKGLGLSTPEIESILALGRQCGALGGKVSGAGAGGAVVLVARAGEGDLLRQRLKAHGIPAIATVTLEGAAHGAP
jgi:mevalonate kinase